MAGPSKGSGPTPNAAAARVRSQFNKAAAPPTKATPPKPPALNLNPPKRTAAPSPGPSLGGGSRGPAPAPVQAKKAAPLPPTAAFKAVAKAPPKAAPNFNRAAQPSANATAAPGAGVPTKRDFARAAARKVAAHGKAPQLSKTFNAAARMRPPSP